MSDGGRRKGLLFSPLVIVIAVVQGFLFVNASYLWEADWPADGAVVYLFLETIFLGWLGSRFVPRTTVLRGMVMWVLGFFTTLLLVYALFTYGLSYQWPELHTEAIMPTFFFTAFFVAPVEELIFRDILPTELGPLEPTRRAPVLLIGSQALFAVFHWAAYGGLGFPMVFAFALGMIWVFASRRWTLWATMGSHTAYNILIIGMFGGIS